MIFFIYNIWYIYPALFPDWSPLLPYMADGTAHYAEKVGDTQQVLNKFTIEMHWNNFIL